MREESTYYYETMSSESPIKLQAKDDGEALEKKPIAAICLYFNNGDGTLRMVWEGS